MLLDRRFFLQDGKACRRFTDALDKTPPSFGSGAVEPRSTRERRWSGQSPAGRSPHGDGGRVSRAAGSEDRSAGDRCRV